MKEEIIITFRTGLSNMACQHTRYPALEIKMRGLVYASVEHAYQAAKTLSQEERGIIVANPDPYAAKKVGKRLTLREDWEEIKEEVMLAALKVKFRHPYYRQLLLATGTAQIVELNSWHDNEWGSCSCPRCQSKGKNKLGRMLMQIRSEIQKNQGEV